MITTQTPVPKGKTVYTLLVVLFFLLHAGLQVNGQISIVNAVLNTFNVTPHSIFEVNISNSTGKTQQVLLEATIYNAANQVICQGKTNLFSIKAGFNPGTSLTFQIGEFNYGAGGQVNYVKTTHILPAGNYKYCVQLVSVTAEPGDEYCDDIQSESSSYLTLVTPFDKDTISNQYPLLVWTHSDPFSALAPGEFFRIVVTEIKDKQNAEEAVQVNQPLFTKDYLTTHQVQYPMDASDLIPGKNYAWEIQEFSAGTMIQKTETWEFTMPLPPVKLENKYGVLRKVLDAGYYLALGNKIFFRFEEEYGGKILSCNIYDEKNQLVNPKTLNEKNLEDNSPSINTKASGYNRYEIDLDNLGLKKGFYRLEVLNEKQEKFLLKIYVE